MTARWGVQLGSDVPSGSVVDAVVTTGAAVGADAAAVELCADDHFESLRAPVRTRFRSRYPAFGDERFDDAYAEFWTREVARAAEGRPSRPVTPVAYVAEGVQRVLIDEGRARARGLARDKKGELRLGSIDELVDAAGDDDTAAAARYEAVAHRALELVRDRLTPREMAVFVSSYLYLQSTPATASALGLSEPRVKKDRARVASKVGEPVVRMLAAELDVCADATVDLPAVFESLVDHAEDCARCSASVAGARTGALRVVGPFELLALCVADPAHGWLEAVIARLCTVPARVNEVVAAMPAGGRGAGIVAAAAVALAGGGGALVASVDLDQSGDEPAQTVAAQRTAAEPSVAVRPLRGPAAIRGSARRRRAAPTDGADGERQVRRRRPVRVARDPKPAAAAAKPTAPGASTASPTSPAPSVVPSGQPAAPPAAGSGPPPGSTEFGFEQR